MSGTHVGRTTTTDRYESPCEFYGRANSHFRFTIDLAASHENALCKSYFTEKDDFLARIPNSSEFYGQVCWLNPPFSQKEAFLNQVIRIRAVGEALAIVVLLPNNSRESDWWGRYVWPHADEIITLTPRIQFLIDGKRPTREEKKKGVPTGRIIESGVAFGCCLAVYRPRLQAPYGPPREIIWEWDKTKES